MDHNATTPVLHDVWAEMAEFDDSTFANPSSNHSMGAAARQGIEDARTIVANAIGAMNKEIIFTSGGTEANNAVLNAFPRDRVLCTTIEHHSILSVLRERTAWHERNTISVNNEGIIKLDNLPSLLNDVNDRCYLFCIMHGNNETGAIQPVKTAVGVLRKSALCPIPHVSRGKTVYVLSDAVQTFGKIPIDVDDLGVDYLSISAHKIYGPKGVGALYVRSGSHYSALIRGGHQERDRRAGTENATGIVGFGRAVQIALAGMAAERDRLRSLYDKLFYGFATIPGGHCNSPANLHDRLPGTLNMRFDGVDGEALALGLSMEGIMVSNGAACEAGRHTSSHVLQAMGVSSWDALGGVRFSLGRLNNEDQIDVVIEAVTRLVNELR